MWVFRWGSIQAERKEKEKRTKMEAREGESGDQAEKEGEDQAVTQMHTAQTQA